MKRSPSAKFVERFRPAQIQTLVTATIAIELKPAHGGVASGIDTPPNAPSNKHMAFGRMRVSRRASQYFANPGLPRPKGQFAEIHGVLDGKYAVKTSDRAA